MRILFVHQSFPGQFKHLAPALASHPGNEVVALCIGEAPNHPAIRTVRYTLGRGSTAGVHPWVLDFETKTIRGEAAFRAALGLRREGFDPDVIIAHPGWGESLFLKEVWPRARMGIYCEFHYSTDGADVGFDPEFGPPADDDACRLRLKNLNNLMHLPDADLGISPTRWQASTFPAPFRDRISVIHDGIDTDLVKPNAQTTLTINRVHRLQRGQEVITFVNRNLEPYRGYHVFMRSLPELLRRRPGARVVIVGGDEVSYGAAPPAGRSWRQIFHDEVKDELDSSRVHFLGKLPYPQFLGLLQVSAVHVYLTYPFVLSWSLLESMSAGCAVVASDTAPLREVISHDQNGRLVPFFDRAALVDQICDLLDDAPARDRLGRTARAFAQEGYDLRRVCLPRQLQWLQRLADAGGTRPA